MTDRDEVMGGPVDAARLAAWRAVLESLPPVTLAVFIAHRVDRRSYRQIARAMGLSERGVERHMLRAIRALLRAAHDASP